MTNNSEGRFAEALEEKTSRLPSDTYLWVSVSAMALAATLQCLGKKHASLFVGQWVAPFLLMGIYNKIVKTVGHDKEDAFVSA